MDEPARAAAQALQPLDEAHHALIQCLMSRKVIDKNLLLEMYNCIIQREANRIHADEDLDAFIGLVNGHLENIGLQIDSGRSDHTGETYYSISNRREDKAAKLATSLTLPQLEFVKMFLRRLLIEFGDEGEMDETTALNLVIGNWKPPEGAVTDEEIFPKDFWKDVKSIGAVQNTIDMLVVEGWLTRNPRNHEKLSLGVRGLIELQDVIPRLVTEDYGPASCTICMSTVFYGICCVTNACPVKVHQYCANEYFRDNEWKCPQCQANWIRLDMPLPEGRAREIAGPHKR